MTDAGGHQLPVFQYPGLSRRDIMHAVEQFYDRYYFRPHVIFRILRRAVFDGNERSRLYVEAKEYLKVRAQRKRSEEHTSELQSRPHLVCRLLLEKKKNSYERDEKQEALQTNSVC